MFTSVHGLLTLSKDCSLASYPSTQPRGPRFGQSDSSKKSPPQLQILNWSEPYSISLSVVQLLLPFKEGTTNYSIQIVHYVPKGKYLNENYLQMNLRENTLENEHK